MGAAGAGFLDGAAARLCAFGVSLLCIAALLWIHRDELFPRMATSAADPGAACVQERGAAIDEQLRQGVIQPGQAELFRNRVAALCAAQGRREEGGVPVLAPGLPPLPGR
jgi:hypothetical protein